MIFSGGMIPTYLVIFKHLHLTNTLWSVILLPAINVYNLVLMRNFFEGIPVSLFESLRSTAVPLCVFSLPLCFLYPRQP